MLVQMYPGHQVQNFSLHVHGSKKKKTVALVQTVLFVNGQHLNLQNAY